MQASEFKEWPDEPGLWERWGVLYDAQWNGRRWSGSIASYEKDGPLVVREVHGAAEHRDQWFHVDCGRNGDWQRTRLVPAFKLSAPAATKPAAEWEERWNELRQYVGLAISVRAIADKMDRLAPAAEEPKPEDEKPFILHAYVRHEGWRELIRQPGASHWMAYDKFRCKWLSVRSDQISRLNDSQGDPAAVELYRRELAEAATP